MRKLTASLIYKNTDVESSRKLYHNIISVDAELLDRGNISDTTNWGIYSNRGTISFIDKDLEFIRYLSTTERKYWSVEIYISDELRDVLIATMSISDYSYDEDTEKVEVVLQDKLLDLQNVPCPRIYPFEETTALTLMRGLFMNQMDFTNGQWLGAGMTSAFETLRAIKVYCPDIQADNVWSALTQMCELGMLRVYSDKNGRAAFSDDDSVYSTANPSKPIIIRSRNILSKPRKTPRTQTIVSNPTLTLTDRRKYTDAELAKIPLEILDVKVNDSGGFYAVYVGEDRARNPDGNITITKTDETHAWLHFQNIVDVSKHTHTVRDVSAIGKIFVYEDYQASENENQVIAITGQDASKGEPDNSKVLINIVIDTIYQTREMYMYALQNCLISAIGDYYEDFSSDENNGDTALATNSLMQTGNKWYDSYDYGNWYIQRVSANFGKGLLCCELECAFTDYYYEDGSLAKNANDSALPLQTFERYEIVEPYVTRNGAEVPLSTYDNGQPMKFRIIGMKYHYEGVIKQTLYLQEYVEQGI